MDQLQGHKLLGNKYTLRLDSRQLDLSIQSESIITLEVGVKQGGENGSWGLLQDAEL